MDIGAYIFVVVISYVLGATPSGYLVGKACGIDVRTAGSGNIGATNVVRILGRNAGAVVLAADALKGFVAARWVPLLALHLFPSLATPRENLALVVAWRRFWATSTLFGSISRVARASPLRAVW